MNRSLLALAAVVLLSVVEATAEASNRPDANSLRLVPFPKRVSLRAERFTVKSGMIIRVSGSPAAKQVAKDIGNDLSVVVGVTCAVSSLPVKSDSQDWMLCISPAKTQLAAIRSAVTAVPSQNESYALSVTSKCAVVRARSEAGLIWGEQALRQLVRANMAGRTLPGLSITDWPSLRYRGFQDDMTRGESSTLQFLKKEVSMGSLLKMNFWTYYMENQYVFTKHPTIGPKGGSMTHEELKALADYAGRYGVDIVGNQQSLGHMEKILEQ